MIKRKELILDILAALLILMFIYTAASKLIDLKRTTDAMNNQPLDNRFTTLLVWGIPTLEAAAATLLLFRRTRRWGFYASLLLMSVFTGYIILVLSNYYDRIPCSCGGVISQLKWRGHLVFNTVFVLIALVGSIMTTKRLRPPTRPDFRTSVQGAA